MSFLVTEFHLNVQMVGSTTLMNWQFDDSGARVENCSFTLEECLWRNLLCCGAAAPNRDEFEED